MTERKLFDGYKDLLRMSSEAYRRHFLHWLSQENRDSYVRFCKYIGETPKHSETH